MRIVFFSDVHANFPALCRALEWAQRHRADRLICAGDLVGHGPHPTEVVRLFMEQRIEAIRGNLDRKVLSLLESPAKLKKRLKKRAHAPAAWAALALGDAERAWLAALPESLQLDIGGVDVLVVHGSPLSDSDYIYPSLTPRALAAKLGEARPRVLVCGHSHVPFTKTVAGVRVVNCGSVGRPVDGDPRGTLALCEFEDGQGIRCRIARVAYPVDVVVADLEARAAKGGMPQDYRTGTKAKSD